MKKLVARSLQLAAKKIKEPMLPALPASRQVPGYQLRANRGFTPYHFFRKSDKGFTLIELIVSVALFAIVMLISISSLLALADANRKAQAIQSVMNNLNIAIDGMVRAIRMGTDYHCDDVGIYTETRSCSNGDSSETDGVATFAFEPFGGSGSDDKDQWLYWFQNGTIYKSEKGSKTNAFAITASDVVIDEMSFHVVGTTRGDTDQPKVLITIKGTAAPQDERTRTSFTIQATATQRLLDL